MGLTVVDRSGEVMKLSDYMDDKENGLQQKQNKIGKGLSELKILAWDI